MVFAKLTAELTASSLRRNYFSYAYHFSNLLKAGRKTDKEELPIHDLGESWMGSSYALILR